MAIFNSLYCKENCLSEGRTAIMPGMVDIPESFEQDEKELTDIQKLNSVAFSKIRHCAPSRTQRVRRLRVKQQDIMSEDQSMSQVLSQDNETLTGSTKPL